VIDSKDPSIPLKEFMYHENRFKIIQAKDPVLAEAFLQTAEEQKAMRWHRLKTLKGL
jgi:pyruvate-ferredoxin/flavodoxin oxidoreductase